MLKQKLIPTSLIDPTDVPPIKIVPIHQLVRFRTINLLFRIAKFVLGSIWHNLTTRKTRKKKALRTRTFLEGMGGLWVKAGQFFSLRLDVLSPEMADEISQLQYHAFGFAPEIARQVVEESLGCPIDEVFDIWGDNPFAAASISQVHRAHLRKEDVWVVIKVQRPGIEQLFERDLRIITWLLNLITKIPATSYIDWGAMTREMQRIFREEIDYRYEASNLRRMRKILRKHKVYVPKFFKKYSGAKILVMEEIKGLLMTDYLRLERNDPARLMSWLKENNIKTRKVGSRLIRSFYRQLIEDNFFHGDLHPGNIILLRNSRFALIDLGAVGSVDKRFLEIYSVMSRELVKGDYYKGIDYLFMMAENHELLDIVPYKTEMTEAYRTWEARSHFETLSYREKSITGNDIGSVSAELSAKYRVGTSWQFLRITRAFSTMDANLSSLMGNTSPFKIQKKYFRQARKRLWKRFRKRGIQNLLGDFLSEVKISAAFATDRLRQEAIRFQGVQSKLHHFFENAFRVIRLAFLIVGVVLLYDFLHQYYLERISSFHRWLGAFGRIAEWIPPYPAEIGVFVLIIVIYLYFIASKIWNRFAEETVRLPNGRLDS